MAARVATGGLAAKLRAELSLERLVESCGVELTKPRSKGGRRTGACLFCGEVGALVVEPRPNTWRCSGCGLSGSVVEWAQHAEGVSFTHAVELLRQGVAITAAGARGGKRPPALTTRSLLPTPFDADQPDAVLLGQVVDFYRRSLAERWEPTEYLATRRLESAEMVDTFQLGYSVRGKLGNYLPETTRVLGAKLRSQLGGIGVIAESGHEAFQGSLIVPVRDRDGTVAQLYGRKLGKALRRGTRMHTWLPGDRPLFNPAALDCREVIVCQSVIDALTLWCWDHRHVVGLAGPHAFDASHVEAFAEHDVARVLIAFRRDVDGDNAAVALAGQLAAVGIECLRVELPNGQDVNDLARAAASPADALATALREASWITGTATAQPSTKTRSSRRQPSPKAPNTAGASTQTPEPKPAPEPTIEDAGKVDDVAGVDPAPVPAPSVDLAGELADVERGDDTPVASPVPPVPAGLEPTFSDDGRDMWLIFGRRRWRLRNLGENTSFDVLKALVFVAGEGAGFHADRIDLYSARARASFCKEASVECGIEEKVLRGDIAKVFGAAEAFVEEAIRRAQEPATKTVTLDPDERAAALELLQDPNLVERITADFARIGVVGEATNCLTGYLVAVSRKLDKPLAVVIQSTSAAGKSALQDAVLSFVPPEDCVAYSAITGQALYYMGDKDLSHKVLAIAEEEGAARAAYPLKLLQSEGEVSIASTGKSNDSGMLRASDYTVRGPAAIFLTTTAIDVDEELLNRCLVLSVNENRDQTRAIHVRQRRAQTLDGLLAGSERDQILKVHRDAQRILEPVAVVNPFADRLRFLDTVTRTRRDHVKYLTLISTIALLHQHQREHHTATTADGGEVTYIEATLADIALANRLAHEVLGRSLDEVPPQTRRVLGVIDELVAKTAVEREIERAKVRFTRRDVRSACGLSDSQCRKHLDRLVELEYLWVHRGERGSAFVYELVFTGNLDEHAPRLAGLVDVDQLHDPPADGSGVGQSSPPSAPASPPVHPPNAPGSHPYRNGRSPANTNGKRAKSPGSRVGGNGNGSQPREVTPPTSSNGTRANGNGNGAGKRAGSNGGSKRSKRRAG